MENLLDIFNLKEFLQGHMVSIAVVGAIILITMLHIFKKTTLGQEMSISIQCTLEENIPYICTVILTAVFVCFIL